MTPKPKKALAILAVQRSIAGAATLRDAFVSSHLLGFRRFEF